MRLTIFPIVPAAKRALLEIEPADCNRINTVLKVIPWKHYVKVIVRNMAPSSNIAPRSKKVKMARDTP